MFDIGADELLLIAVIAIVVIGPKDLPLALRTVGRWVAQVRRVSGHFRTGVEAMIREAELQEMEKKWKEQNDRIMAEFPDVKMTAQNGGGADLVTQAEASSADGTQAAPEASSVPDPAPGVQTAPTDGQAQPAVPAEASKPD